MTSIKLLAASVAALTLAAGAASAQTPYGQTPYGQQTQSDPISAILGALFGDRLGVSSTLDSEWSRGRRPLNTNRTQFESRLNADVRSGAISSSAAASLSAEYGDLVALEARYTADGRVTTRERSDLAERYRAFATRYQAGGQGGYDDDYDGWRPLAESRAAFDARVNAGVRNRTLTRAQANRLTTDFNALVQLETGYQRNGIDSRERQDLEARWADLNRRVGDGYDDGYDSGDNYGSDPRGAQIEARIAAGLRSGEISRTEAASLRLELRDLTRRWAELEARVEQARR
ncbi:hypothetical protein [Brevundimonas sp.]|uniref:hypothetical protein n=1 Tax=Brevundimonas sp. TaxID=1871086 RepID=UPI002CF6918D|nr:hypothetical protein [Brevundimonas sp.]HWQ87519.1 hypothetical protein [Brevundimonas sp.]